MANTGVCFRFIQGLEAGVNRMVWEPDSALYIGGIGSGGNWQHTLRQLVRYAAPEIQRAARF